MGRNRRRSAVGRVFILISVLLLASGGWLAARWWARRQAVPPASGGAAAEGSARTAPGLVTVRTETLLHFSAPDGVSLVEERRAANLPEDTLERCRAILGELRTGPREGAVPLLPVDLEPRSLFLVDTVLVIDLPTAVREHGMGALQEGLFWYSMVNSLILNNRDKVTAVHFLVDGAEADAILGHWDTRGAFRERPDLLRRGEET